MHELVAELQGPLVVNALRASSDVSQLAFVAT
jgi:hypothetical protein